MAIPSKSDLTTLNFAWRGQPFARVEAKLLSTSTLDFAWRGRPFAGAAAIIPVLPTLSIPIAANITDTTVQLQTTVTF